MSRPLDPLIMLATSMHAQPGVYAVLLGSGVSTASGIPTGWGIVRELVTRVASQMDGNETTDGETTQHVVAAADDPEKWWKSQFGSDLGYSSLLGELAPTAPTRQGLLAPFFEPSAEDLERGQKQPTPAHRAIAQLMKQGFVRVVLTTNFDRLMEQALSEVGVQPQVISRPDAVSGMAPLTHAPATIIKLHGDYLDLESLNTDEELARYPRAWKSLLARVLDEYGLIVSGWSADWDTALVETIEESPARRYPLYWDSRSSAGGNATRILAGRAGRRINTADADALFTGLVGHVESLGRLAEPPLTTALAITRLKRFLPDPVRRIDLHDLIFDRIRAVQEETDAVGPRVQPTPSEIDSAIDRMVMATKPLLMLLVNGIRYDDGTHDGLWVESLQALLGLRTKPDGGFYDATVTLQHLPAQLALFAMSAVAIQQKRDGVMVRLATEPSWRDTTFNRVPAAAADVLHVNAVLGHDVVNSLPRWGESGARWIFPQSHLIRDFLSPVLGEIVPSDLVSDLLDDTEYRIALVQVRLGGTRRYPNPGEYGGEWRWTPDDGPYAEGRFRAALERPNIAQVYRNLLGDDEPDAALKSYRELIQEFSRRW